MGMGQLRKERAEEKPVTHWRYQFDMPSRAGWSTTAEKTAKLTRIVRREAILGRLVRDQAVTKAERFTTKHTARPRFAQPQPMDCADGGDGVVVAPLGLYKRWPAPPDFAIASSGRG